MVRAGCYFDGDYRFIRKYALKEHDYTISKIKERIVISDNDTIKASCHMALANDSDLVNIRNSDGYKALGEKYGF